MKHLRKFNENDQWPYPLGSWKFSDQRGRDMSKKEDKWSRLEKDMMKLVEKYEKDFGVDSYGVVDAMHQVLDGMFQKK